MDSAKQISVSCWVVFVSGLLLERFRSAAGKVEFQAKVSKDLALLEKAGASRDLLPPAIKHKAEAALKYQVAV